MVRWHDHWAFVPFKVVWRFIRRSGKRIAVTVVGFAVLLAGVAMLVLPGPGWAAIFLGLAILATEYVWAQRLLKMAKEKAGQARDAVLRREERGRPSPDPRRAALAPRKTRWEGARRPGWVVRGGRRRSDGATIAVGVRAVIARSDEHPA